MGIDMTTHRTNIQPAGLHMRTLAGRVLYSHVVAVRDGALVRLYISGQLARNGAGEIIGAGDMAAQIAQVGNNLQACLAAAGAGLEDLVKTTTYVTDIDEFFRHSDMRMRFFGPGMPASTTVEVRRLSHPDFLVEVDAEAVIDAARFAPSAPES
jgi:enamine deaminase RidA (YjgF/YER057c/UK114 family)